MLDVCVCVDGDHKNPSWRWPHWAFFYVGSVYNGGRGIGVDVVF